METAPHLFPLSVWISGTFIRDTLFKGFNKFSEVAIRSLWRSLQDLSIHHCHWHQRTPVGGVGMCGDQRRGNKRRRERMKHFHYRGAIYNV